jgi:hypothetical protein
VVLLAVLLAVASPALAGPVRCLTYEEKTIGRLQTLCDDGTRAVSKPRQIFRDVYGLLSRPYYPRQG